MKHETWQETLQAYQVSLHEDKGDKFQLIFQCMAEDADHAAEQAENAYPNCEIIHVMQIPLSDII